MVGSLNRKEKELSRQRVAIHVPIFDTWILVYLYNFLSVLMDLAIIVAVMIWHYKKTIIEAFGEEWEIKWEDIVLMEKIGACMQ